MKYQNIIYEKKDGIAKITFNLPQRLNPLTPMIPETQDALKDAEADDKTRAIIITGSGRAFGVGGDIKGMLEFHKANPGELQERLRGRHRIVVQMRKLEKPIIAQINGLTYGAALDLTLGCDLRVAASTARFCEAYLRLGLSPGMGALYMLPRYVGLGRALALILTSREIDAAEAERIGLVDIVGPPDKLEEMVMEYATIFAEGPTKAYGVVKRALYRGLSSTYEEEQDWTAYEQAIEFLTRDGKEGLIAFVEKRRPNFTGKY